MSVLCIGETITNSANIYIHPNMYNIPLIII